MIAPAGRRLGGWGFESESYPVPPPLQSWLSDRLGLTEPFPRVDRSRFALEPPPPVPAFSSNSSQEALDRIAHARGQGLTDLLRLRTATVPALPDAVLRPRSASEIESCLAECARHGFRVIPWGGGTSVTGGVNVVPADAPAVSLDLEHLSGLEQIDETSGLATFGAGTFGPAIERALAPHGLTLGHFPQSFELSTLGGWIVTRSSGQESLGYGSIADMLSGLELVAPSGRLTLPAVPASAAGPDLRQLVLGSEGRFGIVTRATVRAQRRPETMVVTAILLPSWDSAVEAARQLVRENVPLSLLRLSDEIETAVNLEVGLPRDRLLARFARRYLSWRGVTEKACLMLCGAAGDDRTVGAAIDASKSILLRHDGVGLGSSPGRRWLADRYRHPYLRDSLLDHGIATDTLETAVPWSRLTSAAERIRQALRDAHDPTVVLCHVSHPYIDGASLYFTFFFGCPPDPDEAIARWGKLKRAATTAIVENGGTLSHHHGIGSWHAPWYEDEVGARGKRALEAAAASLDPNGILNPHILFDPLDRLEV